MIESLAFHQQFGKPFHEEQYFLVDYLGTMYAHYPPLENNICYSIKHNCLICTVTSTFLSLNRMDGNVRIHRHAHDGDTRTFITDMLSRR